MGLRKILTYKDPALHKVCRPVEKFDWRLHKLLNDMTETLLQADGVGLAAPQVGILRRAVIVDTGEEMLELVNPELVETSGEQCGAEGCLSVPGKYGLVKRPNYAKVRAQNRNGEWFDAKIQACGQLSAKSLVSPVLRGYFTISGMREQCDFWRIALVFR